MGKKLAKRVPPTTKSKIHPELYIYTGSRAYYLIEQAWPYLDRERKREYLRKYVMVKARNTLLEAEREIARRRRLQEALIAKRREEQMGREELQARAERYYYNQDAAVQVLHQINLGDAHEIVLMMQAEDREAIQEELQYLLENPMMVVNRAKPGPNNPDWRKKKDT